MHRRSVRRRLGAASLGSLALSFALAPGADAAEGPSTSTPPYLVPAADGVELTSLLTVAEGATGNGYRLVGAPDGIGATRLEEGRTLIYLNHELEADEGIVRRHGERGAFVSRLVLNDETLAVEHGSDQIDPNITRYDYASGTFTQSVPEGASAEFIRFCSSSLTAPGQLFNEATGRGYRGQLYFANEEEDAGRNFSVTSGGHATQLPRLGLASWENTNVAPNTSDTTLVVAGEDDAEGQLWAYVGEKQREGSATLRAGLRTGTNHVVKVPGVHTDAGFRSAYEAGEEVPFELHEVDWDQSFEEQQEQAALGGLMLNRVEDGAFDPSSRNDFYFATTEGGAGEGDGGGGGLWRLRWADIEHPEQGGTLTLLLDGSEDITLNKPDNLTIDTHGNVLVQEDPGESDSVARVIAYRIADGATGEVAGFDPAQFDPAVAGAGLLTIDEESSGILDVEELLGPGSFLLDAQVHTDAGLPPGTGPGTIEEYVEHGQLLLLRVGDFASVYGS